VDLLNGDWATFFVLTTLMVLPSLLILWWLIRRLQARQFIDRS
jgi:PAT family beta-lactamase induction signal transducer AmpG